MTPALVPSGPPSPAAADNSLKVRQFYRDQMGHALTCQEIRKCDNQAKQRAAVLKQVAQLECNQLPKQQPGEPQPGPLGESNGASWCVKDKQGDSIASSSDEAAKYLEKEPC